MPLTRLDSEPHGGAFPPSASGIRLPRILGEALEGVLAARGQSETLMAVVERSPIPMTMHNGEREHVEANHPAQLMARSSLTEMRRLTVDDFIPPAERPVLDAIWARMLATGFAAGPGPRAVIGHDGAPMEIVIWGMANVLPGLHLFACVPAHWLEDESGVTADEIDVLAGSPLTHRELEVLQLAAEGLSGADIARVLGISSYTVKSHLSNLYEKLQVTRRAGAVAKGMRLGLVE